MDQQQGYLGTVQIKHPRMNVQAELRISAGRYEPRHISDFGDTATLSLYTGASSVQLYATAATLRELAAKLEAAASTLEFAQRVAA